MTKEKYKSWVKKILKNDSLKNKKIFFEVVDLGGNLRKKNVRYHIESSFNTRDKFKIVKITYGFHYSKFRGEKNLNHFIKKDILLEIFKKISNNFKFDFNPEILNFILFVPLSQGRKNDVIIFYADFNLANNQFEKISIGFNPANIKLLSEIANFLKIKGWESFKRDFKVIEQVILDFYPDGECSLKVYQELKASPKIFKEQAKKIFQYLNKFKSVETFGLLTRFKNNKLFSRGIYFRCMGLDFKELSKISCFSRHKRFLKQVEFYVKNLKVRFIAVKDKELEIYFR